MAGTFDAEFQSRPQNDPRLERYLTSLEQALAPFPVSDRAEVITEIKSHVIAALERDPETPLDAVLLALGEPETVANRYLLERGLKPTKTSIHPIVKWLVIGFLGTVAMLLVFTAFAFVHLASHIKYNGGSEIEIYGNVIHFNQDETLSHIEGHRDLAPNSAVEIKFETGKFEFDSGTDQRLSWSCRAMQPVTSPVPALGATGPEKFSLDFSSTSHSAKCTLTVPDGTRLKVDGSTGKMSFNGPRYDLEAKLQTGKVDFTPLSNTGYHFEMSVETGKLDHFESTSQEPVHAIKIHVQDGIIRHEE